MVSTTETRSANGATAFRVSISYLGNRFHRRRLFVLVPTPPAALGFVSFAQAVWNTSRIRNLADPAYQARLQAITSMAFTLGFTLGGLWAGAAIDRIGVRAFLLGAAGLILCSAATAVAARRGVASAMRS